MAKTITVGGSGDGGFKYHQGPGRLIGYLVSNPSATTAQTVSFYDNTEGSGTVLHRITMPAGALPFYVRFGESGRREGIPFSSGLYVDPGECTINVWSIGYEG